MQQSRVPVAGGHPRAVLHFSPSVSPSPPMTPICESGPFTSTPVRAHTDFDYNVFAPSEDELSAVISLSGSPDSPTPSNLDVEEGDSDDVEGGDSDSDCTLDAERNNSDHSVQSTDEQHVLGLHPLDDATLFGDDSTPVRLLSPAGAIQPLSLNAGYKIVFDNIDKNVKPRHMTADSQTVSLHYVQAYAVKDRLDYSCVAGQRCAGATNLYDVLPSSSDYSLLKDNFTVHVSRLVTDYLKFFKDDFKGLATKHIRHKYSSQHVTKSLVVSNTLHWLNTSYTSHYKRLLLLFINTSYQEPRCVWGVLPPPF